MKQSGDIFAWNPLNKLMLSCNSYNLCKLTSEHMIINATESILKCMPKLTRNYAFKLLGIEQEKLLNFQP